MPTPLAKLWTSAGRSLMAGLTVWMIVCSVEPADAQQLSERLRAESIATLADAARAEGDAARGAVLFTKPALNCTRCHVAGATTPIGPTLTGLGPEATDAYLVEALLSPSRVIRKGFEAVTLTTKSGTVHVGRIVEETPQLIRLQLSTGGLEQIKIARADIDEVASSAVSAMPDNLVDQLANRQQFLDLVKYLQELAASHPAHGRLNREPGGVPLSPPLMGMVLIKEFNCQACHQDDVTNVQLGPKLAPDLTRSLPAAKVEFLRPWIVDPLGTRPGTTMPDLLSGLSPAERQAAADELWPYLASLCRDDSPVTPEEDSPSPQHGRELFHSVGCVACHAPRNDEGHELAAASSVSLAAVPAKYTLRGLVAFLENPLHSRPSGRMPRLPMTHWEARDVAAYLLDTAIEIRESDAQPAEVTADQVARGKLRFAELGCAKCHAQDGTVGLATALPLSQVRPDQGCLSVTTGGWPKFSLTDSQRQAIQATLVAPRRELSDHEQIDVSLTGLRCVNCHQRGDLGGIPADRDSYFLTSNPNLGPQGRIPPTLTSVGAKLNAVWMRQVLVSGRTIRPYVLTRMPQYGTENVGALVELFQRADEVPAVKFPAFENRKSMREAGHTLAGTSGLNCIVCHTFHSQQAANMPAVDLTDMAERLKKGWFYHYLRDPQGSSPNTIMPSFWPAGRTMRTDILDGSADLQMEALWQYLLDGKQARAPQGLIVEPLEIVAKQAAITLRRSYPGVGKRGIGVGYPAQINLVFDAEQLRWAMIWQGAFANPAAVWRGQGSGVVQPLGDRVMSFLPGPDLQSAQDRWTSDDGRPPAHRFRGYTFDDLLRPTFLYQFDDVDVADYVVDVAGELGQPASLRRTVTLSANTPLESLVLRAASGKSVRATGDHTFVVDDQLTVQIDGGDPATIVTAGDQQEVLVPLDVGSDSVTVTIEYHW